MFTDDPSKWGLSWAVIWGTDGSLGVSFHPGGDIAVASPVGPGITPIPGYSILPASSVGYVPFDSSQSRFSTTLPNGERVTYQYDFQTKKWYPVGVVAGTTTFTPTTPSNPNGPASPTTPQTPEPPTIGPATPTQPPPSGLPVTFPGVGGPFLNGLIQYVNGIGNLVPNAMGRPDDFAFQATNTGGGVVSDYLAEFSGTYAGNPGFAYASTFFSTGISALDYNVYTAADGALFGSIRANTRGRTVGRVGFVNPRGDGYWALPLFRNPVLNRVFSALHPGFGTDMSIYTRGMIQPGVPHKIGITGPQAPFWLYPGGNIQFIVPNSGVVIRPSK